MAEMQTAELSYRQKLTLLTFGILIPLTLLIGIIISKSAFLLIVPIALIAIIIISLIISVEYIAIALLLLPLFAAILKFYIPTIFGLGLNAVVVPFILVVLVFRFMMNPKLFSKNTPLLPIIAFYLLFYALSLFQTDNVFGGIRLLVNTLVYLLVFVLMYNVTTRDNYRRLLVLLLIALSPSLFVAAQQIVTGRVAFGGYDISALRSDEFGTLRIGGMEHMSELSMKCAFIITIIVVLITVFRPKIIWKILGVFYIALATLVLLKTYSREGWLVMILMMSAFTLRYKKILFVVFIAITIIIGIATWGEIAPRIEPIIYGTDSSMQSRSEAIMRTINLIAKKPFLGYGLGTFAVIDLLGPKAAGYYTVTKSKYRRSRNPTHSFYLEEWFYTGIGGLVFSLWLMIALLKKSFRVYHTKGIKKYPQYRVVAFLFVITAGLVFMQSLLGHTKLHSMWYFWGVCAKIPVLISERENLENISRKNIESDSSD